jgi:hypothetical protein
MACVVLRPSDVFEGTIAFDVEKCETTCLVVLGYCISLTRWELYYVIMDFDRRKRRRFFAEYVLLCRLYTVCPS